MAEATETMEKDSFGPAKDFKSPRTAGPAQPSPNPVRLFFEGLASLRLTVIMLFLGVLLVWFGSLAQVKGGIWHIISDYFRSFIVWIPLDVLSNVLPFKWLAGVETKFPYPGGWLIGAILLANLLTAHALRFRLRFGILMLHSGLVVLLISEFVTGMYAVEMKMEIDEGSSASFAYDERTPELVVIDVTDPEQNRVVAIPASKIYPGALIQDEQLPFDIQVNEFFDNSALVRRSVPLNSLGQFGTLRSYKLEERPVVSGTQMNDMDYPGALLSLKKKDSDTKLGDLLVSCQLGLPRFREWNVIPQKKTVGGKEYHIHLRFKRYYKPYRVHLIDFKFDRYPGTTTAKNYSSLIRMIDSAKDVDREVLIRMNHPLRYEGETFYQSSFKPNETRTVLAVVRNPGWLMPYISCTMVSIGLLVHFSQSLARFLRRELSK